MSKFTKICCFFYCMLAACGMFASEDSDLPANVFGISLIICYFGLCFAALGFILSKLQKNRTARCTQYAEGTLLKIYEGKGEDAGDDSFVISYLAGDQLLKTRVNNNFTDYLTIKMPIGSKIPVWYNPNKPEECIVSDSSKLKGSYSKNVGMLKWGLVTFLMNLVIILLILFIK